MIKCHNLLRTIIPLRSKVGRLLRYWHRSIFLWERWRAYVVVDGGQPTQLEMGRHAWHADYCADPFLFHWQDSNWLFFETLDKHDKGVLGCFKEIDGNWELQGKVLELPCHLSYPQVFEEGGHVYMIPESFDRGHGAIRLFEAKDFPFKWEEVAELIPGGYADSTLLREQGHYYLVCDLIYPKEHAELWHAESLFGPWKKHPQSENLSQSNRLLRCGGAFLNENGKLYRIAQDCNGAYGKRVYKVLVETISPSEYREGRATLVLDREFKGEKLARHTYNRLVVNGHEYEVFDVRDFKLQGISHICYASLRVMLGILWGVVKKLLRLCGVNVRRRSVRS